MKRFQSINRLLSDLEGVEEDARESDEDGDQSQPAFARIDDSF